MNIIPFDHKTHKHCETGVMSNLLHNMGVELSENMLFGIGGGLFFIHFKWIKHPDHGPITAFRYSPGSILRRASKRLKLPFVEQRFSDVQKATLALNDKLDRGDFVGILGDIYYFDVAPEFSELHFNGHNVVIYGYDDEHYYISDPVIKNTIKVSIENVKKARFAKGIDNPKGKMYYFEDIDSKSINLEAAIKTGIRTTCKQMLNPFFPFGGVRGMRLLANDLEKYPFKVSEDYAKKHLNSIILQLEFISGGSGFRKHFTGFLRESSEILNNPHLTELSEEMEAVIVKQWFDVSINLLRCYRGEFSKSGDKFAALSNSLRIVSQSEETFFKRLKAVQF